MSTNYHNHVDNAIRATRRAGSRYFNDDTMRYFGSKTYELYETPYVGEDDAERLLPAYLVMSNRDRGFYSGEYGHCAAYGGRRYYYVIAIVPCPGDIGYSATIEREIPGLPDPGFWTLDAARNLARKLRDSHEVSA